MAFTVFISTLLPSASFLFKCFLNACVYMFIVRVHTHACCALRRPEERVSGVTGVCKQPTEVAGGGTPARAGELSTEPPSQVPFHSPSPWFLKQTAREKEYPGLLKTTTRKKTH